MFVSPKFLTCKVKVLGHEGRDFMNRISALIKDTQGSSPSIAKKKKKKEREREPRMFVYAFHYMKTQ
jgi:hypothetical protein